jgi:hypothetical protein
MKGRAAWQGHALAIGILLLVPFIFFWDMTVANEEPIAADTQAAHSLGAWVQQAKLQQGRTPLWCPAIFSGMPSYGSFIHTPSSPFDLVGRLRQLFPGSRGMRYFISLAIGAAAMYLLLVRRGKSPLPAAAGAFIFAMTPYFLGVIAAGHSTKLQALYLVPLVFLAFDVFITKRTLAAGVFLAGASALQLWNNHPQISYYTLMLGALYAVLRVLLERPAGWRGKGLAWGIGLAVGALLLAAGLVMEPYGGVLEYLPHSIRGGASALEGGAGGGSGWAYATAWSYPLKEILCFAFPGWFGLQSPAYWGDLPFTQSTHYFGVIALILAVIGFLRMRGRGRWVPVIGAGVVLLVGFGRNLPLLYGPMYKLLPMFSHFRVPSMIYAFLPFFAALLAAEGLQSLLAAPEAALSRAGGGAPKAHRASGSGSARAKERTAATMRGAQIGWSWALALGLLFVVWLALATPIGRMLAQGGAFERAGEASRFGSGLSALKAERLSAWKASVTLGLLWIAAAALLLELRRRARIAPVLIASLFAVALAVDLIVVDRKLYDPQPRSETAAYLREDGVVRFLKGEQPPFRIAPLMPGEFQSDRYAAFGIETVGGYQAAKLRIYNDLLESQAIYSPQVLSMLNVGYLLHDQSLAEQGIPVAAEATDYAGRHVFIHRNPFALPRAWFATEARTEVDAKGVLARISASDFDPWKTAYFLASEVGTLPERLSIGEILLQNADGTPSSFRGDDPERFIFPIRVSGPEPALLVMSEVFYAPGWRATIRREGAVKSEPLRLLRANHVLRALLVPPGDHEVEIRAISPGLERGRRLSHAAAALLAAMLLASGLSAWRASRRARAAASP